LAGRLAYHNPPTYLNLLLSLRQSGALLSGLLTDGTGHVAWATQWSHVV
jgi:hypothetical protein